MTMVARSAFPHPPVGARLGGSPRADRAWRPAARDRDLRTCVLIWQGPNGLCLPAVLSGQIQVGTDKLIGCPAPGGDVGNPIPASGRDFVPQDPVRSRCSRSPL